MLYVWLASVKKVLFLSHKGHESFFEVFFSSFITIILYALTSLNEFINQSDI